MNFLQFCFCDEQSLKKKKSPEIKAAAKFHKVGSLPPIALESRIRTMIRFLFVKIIPDLYLSTVLTLSKVFALQEALPFVVYP